MPHSLLIFVTLMSLNISAFAKVEYMSMENSASLNKVLRETFPAAVSGGDRFQSIYLREFSCSVNLCRGKTESAVVVESSSSKQNQVLLELLNKIGVPEHLDLLTCDEYLGDSGSFFDCSYRRIKIQDTP